MSEEIENKIREAIDGLIEKYRINTEELTERQLADAIIQALATGDFVRQVRVPEGAQRVSYLPATKLNWVWENCMVFYWPPNEVKPLVHHPQSGKDRRKEIEKMISYE